MNLIPQFNWLPIKDGDPRAWFSPLTPAIVLLRQAGIVAG
jgi:hypothetical protein